MPPTRDLACNPGMCPDWERNQQPFGSQASQYSIHWATPAKDVKTICGTLLEMQTIISTFLKSGVLKGKKKEKKK